MCVRTKVTNISIIYIIISCKDNKTNYQFVEHNCHTWTKERISVKLTEKLSFVLNNTKLNTVWQTLNE